MSTKNFKTYRFERQVWLLAAGLVGICLVFALLTWMQGARVRLATVDTLKITQQSGQRLILQLNQSVETVSAKNISIKPAALFNAVSSGKNIAVQFTHPLRNATKYTVEINTGGRSIRYSFITAPANFYYVVNVKGGSELHKSRLGTREDAVLLRTDRIEDYIVLGSNCIYTVNNKTGSSELRLHNLATDEQTTLPLPENGIAGTLRAAPDGKSFGFLFAASDYKSKMNNTILVYSLDELIPVAAKGFDNKPFKAFDWQYARNSKTIAALGSDMTLFLLNSGRSPTPLGQFDNIEGFTYDDGGILVTSRAGGRETLSLTSGQRTPIPEIDVGGSTFAAAPLNTEAGLILRFQTSGGTGKIIVSRGKWSRDAYITKLNKTISYDTLSPNDQYVAVELHDANTQTNTIEILDTWNNKVVSKINGKDARFERP